MMRPKPTSLRRSRAAIASSSATTTSTSRQHPPNRTQVVSSGLLWRLLTVLGAITLVANVYFLWPSNNEEEVQRSSGNSSGRVRQRPPRIAIQNVRRSSMTGDMHRAVEGYDMNGKPVMRQNTTKADDSSASSSSRNRILEIFTEAGVALDDAALQELPTWDQVVDLVGERPRIHGLDQCASFRQNVPAVERNLGAGGMFNSGTNLATQLLKNNCKIPERIEKYGMSASREAHGIRWQVPWGKHTPGHYKWDHATEKAQDIDKDSVLPIVTIRNPYEWMKSMCRNGYTARWSHHRYCPHLREFDSHELVPLHVSYAGRQENHSSLLHLWNDWYNDYYRVSPSYPILMVRFEDLIFHAKEMTRLICECAGGQLYSEDGNFKYIVDSAKDGPGHGKVSERTGMIKAWIHYGKPPVVRAGFTQLDYDTSKELLDGEIMETFGYSHPSEER